MSGEFPINLGTTALAQSGGCSPVTNIVGRGDQESEPFEIEGRAFRVDFEADNPGEAPAYAFFNVVDGNGGIVQPRSQDLSENDPDRVEGSATFDSGPGSHTIEITSESADYTIDVEDCGASAVRDASRQPTASQRERGNDKHDLPETGGQGNEKRNLLEAGGPEDGPVPVMSDGSCPVKYPVKQHGACHR